MTEEAVHPAPSRSVELGEIVGTHGVGGLLRLHPYGDCGAALAAARTVFLKPRRRPGRSASDVQPSAEDVGRAMRLTSARPHGRVVLLQFPGIDSIERAEPLVGTVLAVAEDDLPAPAPGEVYAYRLRGLEVTTSDGRPLGRVAETFDTGSSEVLVVRDGDTEHLIPVIADVIRTIDVEGGRVVIDPLPGLLD